MSKYGKFLALLNELNIDFNVPDVYGRTSIFFAAKCSKPDVRLAREKQLIRLGARASATDIRGQTALNSVLADAAVTRVLIENGANPNLLDSSGFGPIHYAATTGDRTALQNLIAGGADISLRTSHGNTAEELASSAGHAAIAAWLRAESRRR